MIAIIDYGVGNLFSLKSSLAMIGAQAVVTGDEQEIRAADRLILPGVGAFGDAVFSEVEPIVDAITPVPGGVGAVTTSVLMKHVVEAAERA